MNPERAMVIVAHPDDAEFLAGGSVAIWASTVSTARSFCQQWGPLLAGSP